MTTSIHDNDEITEYITDPELIHEKYYDFADLVIDGGMGEMSLQPSLTVPALNQLFSDKAKVSWSCKLRIKS